MAGKFSKDNLFTLLGAATGLGNALRFPALCVEYGCSFIFAYVAVLALAGYPLLCGELGFSRLKTGARAKKIWRVLVVCGALNSALIATYYGGICAKLIGGAADCVINDNCFTRPLPFLPVFGAIFMFVAAYVALNGGQRRLALTGKLSIYCCFLPFIFLAACAPFFAVADGPEINAAALAKPAVWKEALAQCLLSLSLAGGVMPRFAQSGVFSVKGAAAKIIAANFSGGLIAALGTLPYVQGFPAGGVIDTAFAIFPQILNTLFALPSVRRIAGAAIYLSLFCVALHSTCSLAQPALALARRRRPAALVFLALSALLSPLFYSGEGELLQVFDFLTCSIICPVLAAGEASILAYCLRPKFFRRLTICRR